MKGFWIYSRVVFTVLCVVISMDQLSARISMVRDKPRVIVTSDGEIDDECSFVRFLLYANEWDIEGIITSSSQYHWHRRKWAGDDWAQPYLAAYAGVYPNPVKRDKEFPSPGYRYQERRWYGNSAWGRERLKADIPNDTILLKYLKPIWRWADTFLNDFAARADWCVKSFEEANSPPMVKIPHAEDLKARPGEKVKLSARGTLDPDGNEMIYHWWHDPEAGTFSGIVDIPDAAKNEAEFTVPEHVRDGNTIHIILAVNDLGTPALTRYKRTIITVGR